MNEKKIFVSGATGFQGGSIAKELLTKGYKVSSVSKNIPTDSNSTIEFTQGGFENQKALQSALSGAYGAVFTFPLIYDLELAKTYTSNFVNAAKAAGVELVVFNTGFDLRSTEIGYIAMDQKIAIKQLLDDSGLKVITLVPDIYIDNLAAHWSIPAVVNDGVLVYPVPNGEAVPWVSHSDLGRYVVAAFDHPELAGETLPIGGNVVSGDQIASAIAEKLGKEVNFIGLTPDVFEENLKPAFGEMAAKEISNLYRFVADNLDYLRKKDFKRTQEILGVTPQSLKDWVASVEWKING